jgi:hypothetical protein
MGGDVSSTLNSRQAKVFSKSIFKVFSLSGLAARKIAEVALSNSA